MSYLKQDNTNHGDISTLLQSHCQSWNNLVSHRVMTDVSADLETVASVLMG